MFTRKDYLFLAAAILLVLTAFVTMAFDPSENGMGILTRTIAPIILLAGLLLPIPVILGRQRLASDKLQVAIKKPSLETLAGITVFAITFSIYLFTLEPTASLWDCSEFIASAYKLQVPHTPGAPLSLLIGRIFTLFAWGDVTRVACMVNAMSAFFSALTVLLVYIIILVLGKRMENVSIARPALIVAATAGSLCLAVSDTFWFSAVEAETYGASCFFMVLIVWLIFTGQDLAEPDRSRRLVLIFYIAGLSYCIHPMSLLSLPILPVAWYSSSRAWWRILLWTAVGALIILFINRFIAVGIFELAFYVDLFLVNSLGFAFYSGALIVLAGMVFLFVFLLRKYTSCQAYTWAVVFLMAGFLPYGMMFVRSNDNPPIDEGNPENLSLIKAYMNRESYPSRPLLYGPYFDAQIEDVEPGKRMYHKGSDHYELTGTLSEYKYTPHRQTILPRIYSNDPAHVQLYQQWTGLKPGEKPGFAENIAFLLQYQIGHMYLRYLLWNFAGRDGDVQGSDWLAPWDAVSSGSAQFAERAHNQYWMIPLLIGIAGSIFHFQKNRRDFISTAAFFLLTGLILVLYLNSTPNEPRERDYIYVGSYIAFCIWIGIGFIACYHWAKQWKALTWIVTGICFAVPVWMFYQNYDDHNRSGRTFQIDHARNTLASCAPNAILFTGGDNDTFPFWYLQEVEGYRTDVRVVVLSYFNTDWYIGQLKRAYYKSKAFNLSLPDEAYRQYGPNDVLYLQESIQEGIDVEKYLALLKAEHPALRMKSRTGDEYTVLPSRTLKIPVHRQQFLASDQAKFLNDDSVNDALMVRVTENYLEKNALAFLDLVISNAWQRPVYFNYTSLNTFGLDLKPYMVQEGTVFRLLPVHPQKDGIAMNTTLMYKNLVERADYSNLSDKHVYFNYEDYMLRMIVPLQQTFNTLAEAFYEEGNPAMAEKVLTIATEKVYRDHLTPTFTSLQASQMLLALGKKELAEKLSHQVFDYYYDQAQQPSRSNDQASIYMLQKSADILSQLGKEDYLIKIKGLTLGSN